MPFFPDLQAAYDATWLNPHGNQPARPVAAGEVAAEPPQVSLLITAPPPPSPYVCNPAHIFVQATMKETSALIFDKFYDTVLSGIDYAIDSQGRSYLNIRLQVLNPKP